MFDHRQWSELLVHDRTVFIHTNDKQKVGALVAQHSLIRNSATPGRFRVVILEAESTPLLRACEGKTYLREGKETVWRNDDLQSFVPLRFSVPQLMGYQGRAVVIDPDIFAVGDINELFDRDMRGKAILARQMPADGRRPLHHASSVMLLDCEKLRHWAFESTLERLFTRAMDYRDWMWLLNEPEGSVGTLESFWTDFDHLDADTRLLHNTHRRTQPWKTGLPADFTSRGTRLSVRIGMWARRLRSTIDGSSPTGYYRRHPDRAQESLFFRLLGECLDQGTITEAFLRAEIELGHIRPDALRMVARGRSKNGASASTAAAA